MANRIAAVLKFVRHVAVARDQDLRSDSQLLGEFVAGRDEAAFAAILHRHESMVLRVCRQVLQDAQDAEDAFQATFLVLARRAASIREQDSLAAWLHRVAVNLAVGQDEQRAKKRASERQAGLMSKKNAMSGDNREDLEDWLPLVHEEVNGLPEKYRVAIVQCYFQGKTHEEAAHDLGWPLGTVKGRLARARDLLRTRLARRGVVLSAAGLVAAFTHGSAAGQASATLLGHTLQAALAFAVSGTIPAGAATAQAVSLAKGALAPLVSTKLLATIVLLVGAALVGAATFMLPAPESPRALVHDQIVDAEPLPQGVLARMGSPRFRHGGPVSSMAYLADGKILATGGSIGTHRSTGIGRIRLWDVATGKELRQFHLKGTAHVAASPDGKILAGADESAGVIHLWEATTGKEIRKLKSSRSGYGGILPIAFSGDGKKLVAGGHEVRLWDVETGKLLHSLRDDESAIQLAFSADSKILAVTFCDLLPPRRFQVDPWKELAPLQPKRSIELLAMSPDSKTLALTAEASGSIYLHDAVDGTELREIQAHQVRDPLRPAKFWLTREEARDMKAHQILDVLGQKRISALAFAPDGKTLASAAADKAVRLWDVATGKERQSFPGDSYAAGCLAFAPDGKSLAWADSAGVIRIWDLRTGKALHGHEGHQGVVAGVALSDGGKTLITAGADATIRLWATATGKELRRLEGHEGPIASVHLAPDGKMLASVSPGDRTVRVWELATGKELRRFRASTTYCDAAWMPDSRTLVIRRYLGDSTVHFCDVVTGKETLKVDNVEPRDGMNFAVNVEGVNHGGVLAVSPDGKMLVTSVNFLSPSFHLWDAATGKELPSLWPDPRHQVMVRTAIFSPDSKTLIVGSANATTLDVWDLATRKSRQLFASTHKVMDPDGEEHDVPSYWQVRCAALSPDGRTLAATGDDPGIRLWDAASGKERRLEGHRGAVTSLAWSADGKLLVSGSNDGTALVWRTAD